MTEVEKLDWNFWSYYHQKVNNITERLEVEEMISTTKKLDQELIFMRSKKLQLQQITWNIFDFTA